MMLLWKAVDGVGLSRRRRQVFVATIVKGLAVGCCG
jgi:hypothetical protein